MGNRSTLMITEDGDMSVFGNNDVGQLGLGHQDYIIHPRLIDKVVFGGDDIVMASAGALHSGCVTSTGSLWMWGDCIHGQLGIPQEHMLLATTQPVPQQVFAQSPVLMVACGNNHTILLTRAKHVWSCGVGDDGQLGHNDTEPRHTFTQIDPQFFGGGASVGMIAAGYWHSMALSTAGDMLWTWGKNKCGQLGHRDREDKLIPTAISAATFGNVAVVSMDGGSEHTLVVRADSSLWGCGSDEYGELGLNEDPNKVVAVVPTLQRVTGTEFADRHGVLMAACGNFHSVVLAKNYTVWVCGVVSNLSFINAIIGCTRSLTLIDQAHFAGNKICLVAAGNDSCGAVTEDGNVIVWGPDDHPVGGNEGIKRRDIMDIDPVTDDLRTTYVMAVPMVALVNNGPMYLRVRIGRWHDLRLEHAIAFTMIFHGRLGANASIYKNDFPQDLLRSMFDNMHLQPRLGTPHGLHNMIGRRP